jgi:PLP dependent protein
MPTADNIKLLQNETANFNHILIAVTKTHPPEKIMEAYNAGLKKFGENKVQELLEKKDKLPSDIEWHLIGHLQTNKVKYIAPFINLIHSVDSLKLAAEIDKQAQKSERKISCLLQVHISSEKTKFGFTENELTDVLKSGHLQSFKNISIKGLMGMASFTDDKNQIRTEFNNLKRAFEKIKTEFQHPVYDWKFLSMGMSSDYMIALEEGSNMIRVGSAIFGNRNYHK